MIRENTYDTVSYVRRIVAQQLLHQEGFAFQVRPD